MDSSSGGPCMNKKVNSVPMPMNHVLKEMQEKFGHRKFRMGQVRPVIDFFIPFPCTPPIPLLLSLRLCLLYFVLKDHVIRAALQGKDVFVLIPTGYSLH